MLDTTRTGAYQIQIHNKKYVGGTMNSFSLRWSRHLADLRRGVHANKPLQNAFNEYGEECLEFSILEIVEIPEEILIVEQHYIDTLNPECNVYKVAGRPSGIKRSAETKKKMSIAHQNMSDETKQKLRIIAKNISDKTRENMSVSAKKAWEVRKSTNNKCG